MSELHSVSEDRHPIPRPQEAVAMRPREDSAQEPARPAQVRVAVPLREEERHAVQERLEAYFGHPLQLEVQVDDTILGGVWVRVGDIVLDGSLRGRLESLRHHLRSQCRVMMSTVMRSDDRTATAGGERNMSRSIRETSDMDIVSQALLQQLQSFRFALQPVSMGTVTEVADGIVRISGLHDIMVGEMIAFEDETPGMALNLEAHSVGAIVLGSHQDIVEGSSVRALGHVVSVPVGNVLLGRIVDALGRPIDDRGPIRTNRTRLIERPAPGIIERAPVNRPLQTGVKAIDALVPLGRGQRELIIGDRQTGKTAIAVDAILNQRAEDVLCVYVAIGQKLSNIAHVVATLERYGALEHTIVVAAEASAPAAMQYIAPYAGCAMAEEFMEHGRDVLIVYDDLTKHAWAYRQLSLLLRRPPGREAFPGDIFYLHARLLERAGHLNEMHGGGSLTALPIIETQMGDLAAYIPTNVISITDGQIFLEGDLFHAGIRPAVNAGLSVSRVAGAAQCPAMKQITGQMRLDLAQYRELAAFAQFGTELDRVTRQVLDRGARLLETLKQPQNHPVALEDQIVILYAVTQGYLDDVPVEAVASFEEQLVRYLHESNQGLRNAINIQRELSPEIEQALQETIVEFKQHYFTAA